ncbi:TPA: hypothetical protein QHY04_004413, partial [Citrobacter koseri]|nr:hypothetical protein [Citrobacter koseri]
LVSHLKHELNLSNKEILDELNNKGIQTPLSPLGNTVKRVKYAELKTLTSKVNKLEINKFVEDLLCEEKVVEKMVEMDKKSLDCES